MTWSVNRPKILRIERQLSTGLLCVRKKHDLLAEHIVPAGRPDVRRDGGTRRRVDRTLRAGHRRTRRRRLRRDRVRRRIRSLLVRGRRGIVGRRERGLGVRQRGSIGLSRRGRSSGSRTALAVVRGDVQQPRAPRALAGHAALSAFAVRGIGAIRTVGLLRGSGAEAAAFDGAAFISCASAA